MGFVLIFRVYVFGYEVVVFFCFFWILFDFCHYLFSFKGVWVLVQFN